MSLIAFLFAVAAAGSGLLACAALNRRSALLSTRMRRAAGHEALRLAAAAVVFTMAATALALA